MICEVLIMAKTTDEQIYAEFPIERLKYVKQYPYVGDDGIYVPIHDHVIEGFESVYKLLIPKEVFVEAYNKWINCDENK